MIFCTKSINYANKTLEKMHQSYDNTSANLENKNGIPLFKISVFLTLSQHSQIQTQTFFSSAYNSLCSTKFIMEGLL